MVNEEVAGSPFKSIEIVPPRFEVYNRVALYTPA
jgi:hypothetical protein